MEHIPTTAKSKVFCILFFFPVWPDKQFIYSDRWNLKTFQTIVELVGIGNGGVGPKVLLMSFPPAVLCQNSVITIFPPSDFCQIQYIENCFKS
jgi:hypothetical protein